MPRKIIINQNTYPYHVYNRSIDKKFFEIPLQLLWKIFTDNAFQISTIWNAHIHSLVLMGNHFHMLISTPDSNIGECMREFQSEIARSISWHLGSDGYRFQSRYRWSIIQNENWFRTVFKYVYLNPVKAKICSHAEAYPYSTLHGIVGNSMLKVPIKVCSLAPDLFSHPSPDFLNWINHSFSFTEQEQIGKSLCHRYFKLPILKSSSRSRKKLLQKINNY